MEAASKSSRDYHAEYLARRPHALEYQKKHRVLNREKIKARHKRWVAKNRLRNLEINRASQTKGRYGLTRAQHKEMYEEQKHCCAICGVHESSRKMRLAIDHNHTTGAVRGLLCTQCNSVLGYAKEKIEILRAAISYLEKHNG